MKTLASSLLIFVLAVLAANAAAADQAPIKLKSLDDYVIHGKVDGERTDFVDGVPESLARTLTRVTRTVECFSCGGPERQRNAPWLYPLSGKYPELPRVFVEDGKEYYPIRGTWRRVLGSGVHHYDENGVPTDRSVKEAMPHHCTKVDFYVVPLVGESRWVVTLIDDSRIVVTPDSPMLPLVSELLDAAISIPVSAVRKVEPNDQQGVKVDLSNGDRISGRLAGDAIAARAVFGRIAIPAKYIRRIEVTEIATGNAPPGKFQADYAGLRWDLWRTGWKGEDGNLASQRYARPGFNYGHWGNGRGGLAITGNGDKSWVDYEVAFDFKMLPANREFFSAYIPGDSRGMSVIFRAKSASESWNQPATYCSFGISPSGGWSLIAAEDWFMTGRGYNSNNCRGKYEKLASGKSESCKDASEGRLRLRVQGNTITVWLNDEQLVEHTHNGQEIDLSPYGGFGIQWRFESMGWISNLEVQEL